MATIRKRTLPSGLVRWQVDFTDQAGKRRSKLFPRRKDADVYLVKVRSLVANHTYLADSESITVAEAAKSWLDHCEVRCKTGRRMERSTWAPRSPASVRLWQPFAYSTRSVALQKSTFASSRTNRRRAPSASRRCARP